MSADLKESEEPGPHYQGDVRDVLDEGWDLMVAHPPCTYLANSGVWALHDDGDRWQDLIDGAVFFRDLLQADIPRIAVENPVMHKYAKKIIGCGDQDQTIQPYEFGHYESKRTCLWLKNLPELEPTDRVQKRTYVCECGTRFSRELGKYGCYGCNGANGAAELVWDNQTGSGQNRLSPSEDRSEQRARTYEGIAEAMAEQWGGLDEEVNPLKKEGNAA